MHQSTTPSLSQTIWPRWASRQFLSLPIVLTLLPVTFGYSLRSEAVVMRQLRRWKRLWWRALAHSHKWNSMEPSRSCWNGTTAGRDYFEGDLSFMCILSIKVPIRKISGNLFNDPRIYIYIYIYIYIWLSCPTWDLWSQNGSENWSCIKKIIYRHWQSPVVPSFIGLFCSFQMNSAVILTYKSLLQTHRSFKNPFSSA